MKKHQIIALFLSAVIGVSACVPAPGSSAFASEKGTTSDSESVLSQNADDSYTDTTVESTDAAVEGDTTASDSDKTNSTAEGETVSESLEGSEGGEGTTANGDIDSGDGMTNAEADTSDIVIDSTDSGEAAADGSTNTASAGETSDVLSEDSMDETAEETESSSDAKALLASDPGGSFETAVEVMLSSTTSFPLEDYGGYYLKFTPSESGVYTFYGTTNYQYAIADCTLYGSAGTENKLAYKDGNFPDENGRIFELSQELDAEHTYYLYVENWDVAFDMTIHVTKPGLYAEAEEVEYIQNVGKPITLKVNADSPFPLTYEWRNTKGNVISGATTDTYVYTPKSVGAQTFTCKVSDGNNSKTVKFHFSVADFVDLTPVNETVTADYGTKVVLKTTVDSPFKDKLTYQWRDAKNNNIAGATKANYTITVKKNTTYSCMVQSPYGAYDIVHFYVNVNSYLFVYADNAGTDANGNLPKKASFTRYSQEPITFKVITDSTDTTGLKYQWYQMKESGSSSYPSLVKTAISGATKSSLYLETPSAGTYICTVTDSYGNKDSASFNLKISNELTTYPEGAEESSGVRENYVYIDANTSESIELRAITSADKLTGAKYSWYEGSFTDPEWTAVSGSRQESVDEGTESGTSTVISSLTVPGKPNHSVRYKCVVKDSYGNYGAAYFYIIWNNLKVTSPNGELAFDGYYKYKTTVKKEMEEPLTLQVNVEADNTSGIEYGWFYFAPGSNTATILSGNGNSYNVNADKPGFYECRFTDRKKNSRCVEFKVIVNTGFKAYPDNAPMVDGQRANRIRLSCELDDEVTLITRASSYESWEISYKWFDPKGKELTEIGDSSTAAIKPTSSGTYFCKVNDGYGNTLYAFFDVEIDNGLSIVPVYNAADTSITYDQSRNELTYNDVVPGSSVKLKARVTADDITGLKYEWRSRELYKQSDWTVVSGAGSGVLTVTPAYDKQYECRVTDCFGTSRTVYYTVKLADSRDLGNSRMLLSRTYYVCDAKPKTPKVVMQYKGETLREGTDYSVVYENNINAGTAVVIATAIEGGGYTGTCSRTFTIRKTPQTINLKKYASRLLVGDKTQIIPTGIKQSAKVTFSSSNKTVATIDKKGNIVAKKRGSTVITITSAETGYYAKTVKKITIGVVPGVTKSFIARNWKECVYLTWSSVPGATKYNIYRNGELIRTLISRANSLRDEGLIYNGYTTSLNNGTFYTYKIQAENTAGKSTKSKSVSTYWLERPDNVIASNNAKLSVVLKWTKNKAATGYIIEYTADKSFNKGVTEITTNSNYPQKTINKLVKGKTYRFRVRSYRKYNGKNYYSAWSDVKTVKVTK